MFNGKRRLWLQSPSLRSAIIRDHIDMFFAGAEYFPLFLPRPVTVATTIHDVAYRAMPDAISFTNSFFYNFLFPFFVKRADYFFTVSQHSKNEMINYLHIDADRITVVHNGISLSEFTPAGKNEKEDFLLFVGTLQPRKNLVNIVRAFSLIAGTIDDSLVIVGGSGWKNSPLAELMESLEKPVRDRIVFKGYVDGDELARLYRRARLFVLPSLHEGFCLPILEAMASGTAVLTAPRTAIPEIFGDAAKYADPLSPEDIAAKMKELLSDSGMRARLEKKGLSLSKKYDVSKQASGFLAAFKSIAAARGRTSRTP
jgi:glycosyltransferase involved in cell wall biosynthesis